MDFAAASRSVRRVLFAAAMRCCRPRPRWPISTLQQTGSRVGVAVGYKDTDGSWTTEGWWNLSARSCETLLKGTLVARYYYIYAIDYDRGGEWSGQAFMCTRDKEFTIKRHRGLPGARLSTAPASSRSTPASSAPGRCSSPRPARQRRSGRCTPGTPVLPTPGRQGPSQLPGSPPPMRRLRRTKIVATLGPASGNPEMIARLFEAGADVFRINMSHTSHDRMRELVAAIRAVEKRARPADRHPGRSAGTEAARRRLRQRPGDARQRRDLRVRHRTPSPATRRACTCRIRKSSPASRPATRCCSTTARSA